MIAAILEPKEKDARPMPYRPVPPHIAQGRYAQTYSHCGLYRRTVLYRPISIYL